MPFERRFLDNVGEVDLELDELGQPTGAYRDPQGNIRSLSQAPQSNTVSQSSSVSNRSGASARGASSIDEFFPDIDWRKQGKNALRGAQNLGGRVAKVAPLVAPVVDSYSVLQDPRVDSREELAGGIAGSITGGAIGATIGAGLGSFIPVAGTAIGGTLGSMVGSGFGKKFGIEAGEMIDSNTYNKNEMDQRKIQRIKEQQQVEAQRAYLDALTRNSN